jgi:broad specificity phosphatase PhoE
MSSVKTRVLLVRHGQTPWNEAGRWQGHADPGLTALGRSQAKEVAQTITALTDRAWSRIVASDLERARQTAAAVASALSLPVEEDARLRELDVGRWSGLTRAEIESLDPETLRAFERGEPAIRPGGGESRIEIRERAHAFACDLAERLAGESIIVVTHLGIIRALVPGAEPSNADTLEIVAEEIAARPIDRVRRREEGAL